MLQWNIKLVATIAVLASLASLAAAFGNYTW